MSAGSSSCQVSKVLEEAFRMYDKNGDGEISAEELVMTMNALKYPTSLAKAHKTIEHYDRDNSGTMELDEFKLMITDMRRHEAIFNKLDIDHSGFITRDELSKHLQRIKPNLKDKELEEDLDELMEDIDVNHDGRINLGEFSNFLSYLQQCEGEEQQQQ